MRLKHSLFSQKAARYCAAFAFLLFALAVIVRFEADRLYNYPPNVTLADIKPEETLIVVLSGGKGRIMAAMELYEKGFGKDLFIVGADPKANKNVVLKHIESSSGIVLDANQKNHIEVETESTNTIENVYVVQHRLRVSPEIREVILVTSSYHMRRSLYLLQHHIDPRIKVHPYTMPSEEFMKRNWAKSWLGIEVTVEEYFKYQLAKLIIPQLERIN